MLNPSSISVPQMEKPVPSLGTTSPSDFPLFLWSQLDPATRQRLSQRIAELIRRIRFPLAEKEVCDDETV